MRKIGRTLLAFALLLGLTGCAEKGQEPAPTAVPAPSASETATPAPTAEPALAVEFTECAGEVKADDGTVLLTYRNQTPVVSGTAGADAINRTWQGRAERFLTGPGGVEEWASAAKDYYESGQWRGAEPYAMEGSVCTGRIDDAVVSFSGSIYTYTQGAHGYTGVYGLAFDSRTGTELRLADLTADPDALKRFCEDYVLELTKDEQYYENGPAFFVGYEQYVPDVIADGLWYFDDAGMTFIAQTYVLGSYAAGTFFFTIPYSDLTEHVDAKWLLQE